MTPPTRATEKGPGGMYGHGGLLTVDDLHPLCNRVVPAAPGAGCCVGALHTIGRWSGTNRQLLGTRQYSSLWLFVVGNGLPPMEVQHWRKPSARHGAAGTREPLEWNMATNTPPILRPLRLSPSGPPPELKDWLVDVRPSEDQYLQCRIDEYQPHTIFG